MWQIWIDTGGTFTDGLARDPAGTLHRAKVLSSARLRGRLTNGHVAAPWATADIFTRYQLRVLETGEEARVTLLDASGRVETEPALRSTNNVTVELWTGEEAPVLAARLLTQTPLDQPFPPLEMRLGTTRGTNALLERRGGRVALLVTAGFADLLKIGTQQRPDLFQLAIPPAEVLYEHVLEVPERISAEGNVLEPLSNVAIDELIETLRSQRPDAVAVSLLHGWRNPAHEQRLRSALARAGFANVTLGSEMSTAPGYLARTQTAVVNAYLTPVLATYLSNVQQQLGRGTTAGATVRVMTSAGSLVRADRFQPKDSLLSGPAGGVQGASNRSRSGVPAGAVASGFANVLTLDMGGTSTDVARLANGVADTKFTTLVAGQELQLPSLAIETVAAGGGSICWFDGEQLRVGPQSAGATPGPACYGSGEELTITDVNLLLGRLHPAQFGIPIFPERAQQSLVRIADEIAVKVGRQPEYSVLLAGFARIADEAMAAAIRTISVAKGYAPADHALVVFGGAGGLHGCAVAEELGITKLILPVDGGLLSAWGIGQADIRQTATQTLLRPLSEVTPNLPRYIQTLTEQATTLLRDDVGVDTPVETIGVTAPHGRAAAGAGPSADRLALRLLGQQTALDVAVQPNDTLQALETRFQEAYRWQYGHLPTAAVIEAEALRVTVRATPPPADDVANNVAAHPATPAFHTGQYPAYRWDELAPGATFSGPALLLNATSSAFIAEGWHVALDARRNAQGHYVAVRQQRSDPQKRRSKPADEPVQLTLFTQRFRAIADTMGAQLQRTAFSTNIKERLDFSCALLDARARLVVNAPHIPVHLGSLGVCARLMLKKLGPLRPGDVAMTNHPRYGGSHLPDVTLLKGVFGDDGRLLGYVINRAHHAEIGGRTPGSMPPDATSLAEEGVALLPQLLVEQGELRWNNVARQFTDVLYPTRALAENRADLDAALAALATGEQALQTLARQHGAAIVARYMRRLAKSATDALRPVLARHAGQTFTAEEFLDDGHRIAVRIDVAPANVTFDFRGTTGPHPHNLNANRAILHSALLYVLRLWVAGREQKAESGETTIEQPSAPSPKPSALSSPPLNEGLMRDARIVLPRESLLNPRFQDNPARCPAVVGGNTEVSQRLVDTLLKALGLAACSQGTMNNFLFGKSSATESSDRPAAFGYYETLGGGAGATFGAPGRSGVHQHMTNTCLTDAEELERRYPVRLRRFSLRPGSGGAGQWPGGDGLIREVEFLTPVEVTLVSQHRHVAPYGLAGGQPGQPGVQTLRWPDGTEEAMPGIFSRAVPTGTVLRIETPGGGGVGT